MSSFPENINFGNPNAYPTNFPQLDTFNQIPDNKSTKIEGDDKKQENKTSDTSDKITNFLNIKSTTILTFAIAIAIGFGIKDLLNSIAYCIYYTFIPNIQWDELGGIKETNKIQQ